MLQGKQRNVNAAPCILACRLIKISCMYQLQQRPVPAALPIQ